MDTALSLKAKATTLLHYSLLLITFKNLPELRPGRFWVAEVGPRPHGLAFSLL